VWTWRRRARLALTGQAVVQVLPRDLDGQVRPWRWRVRDEKPLETSADRPQLPKEPFDIERADVAVLGGLLRELLCTSKTR